MGGLMGLWMGFSLLSAVEVIYWFLVRWGILLFKRKKMASEVGPTNAGDAQKRHDVKENIRETEKQVFDEIFAKK